MHVCTVLIYSTNMHFVLTTKYAWPTNMHAQTCMLYYSTFVLTWSSLMYSSCGISGMFHLRKTGCNGYVPVHGYCNTMFTITCAKIWSSAWEIMHIVSVSKILIFNKNECSNHKRGRWGKSETKEVVCNSHDYYKKQTKKGGITIRIASAFRGILLFHNTWWRSTPISQE